MLLVEPYSPGAAMAHYERLAPRLDLNEDEKAIADAFYERASKRWEYLRDQREWLEGDG